MKILSGIVLFALLAGFVATTNVARTPTAAPCSMEWFGYLDSRYFDISDGDGHGPDIGSSEWLNAFEARAGLPATSALPTPQRCEAIQARLGRRTYLINARLGWVLSL
ncbi:hypothetical protein [Burkholderia sp. Ac-20379]|uniref:hypothetical protein n=1 Tax=Burkholderia sp. Ac-20379 TaxID=2703900 RepID=UPI00197E124F|nr:hypothetical protein [Burkholderia sp. Ac-20379]MBN3725162.1 hypothetical protein [Burkholderia sp. Ac-20379]